MEVIDDGQNILCDKWFDWSYFAFFLKKGIRETSALTIIVSPPPFFVEIIDSSVATIGDIPLSAGEDTTKEGKEKDETNVARFFFLELSIDLRQLNIIFLLIFSSLYFLNGNNIGLVYQITKRIFIWHLNKAFFYIKVYNFSVWNVHTFFLLFLAFKMKVLQYIVVIEGEGGVIYERAKLIYISITVYFRPVRFHFTYKKENCFNYRFD